MAPELYFPAIYEFLRLVNWLPRHFQMEEVINYKLMESSRGGSLVTL